MRQEPESATGVTQGSTPPLESAAGPPPGTSEPASPGPEPAAPATAGFEAAAATLPPSVEPIAPPPGPPPGPQPATFWSTPPERRRRNPIVLVALVIAVIVLAGIGGLIFLGANLSPYDRTVVKIGTRLAADPGFAQKYKGVSGQDAFSLGAELGSDGGRRVDDATRLEFWRSLDGLLGGMDAPTCAAVARGTTDNAAMQAAFRKADPAIFDQYADATIAIILASVHGDPAAPKPAPSDDNSAFQAWTDALGGDEFNRASQALGASSGADTAMVCQAERELIHSAVSLPDPARRTVLLDLFLQAP
jgi:hypothetical protein